MHKELAGLKNKIKKLEANVPSSSVDISQLIYEPAERDHCSSNLIAHGIPESTSVDLIT